jgi:hypothetical protein
LIHLNPQIVPGLIPAEAVGRMTLPVNPILKKGLQIDPTSRLQVLPEFIRRGNRMLSSQQILPRGPEEYSIP